MTSSKAYKTIQSKNQDEFIINKSRFIGHACPVKTEQEALAFLNEVKTQHKAANHNCYAYIIGQNAGIQRYSDDGEPSGTAGLPIIEVIKAREVVDVCVVVTRYFGGILLGAGGLIRAYAQGSKTALDAGRVVTMHKTKRLMLDCGYPMAGKLDHWLKDQPVILNAKEFGTDILYDLSVKHIDLPAFLHGLEQIGAGKLAPIEVDDGFQGWDEAPPGPSDS